jgi:hypothetical protein
MGTYELDAHKGLPHMRLLLVLRHALQERERQHTSAYVSIRQHTSHMRLLLVLCDALQEREDNRPCVSIRQHTSAYVSIRQHTSAYLKEREDNRPSGADFLSMRL